MNTSTTTSAANGIGRAILHARVPLTKNQHQEVTKAGVKVSVKPTHHVFTAASNHGKTGVQTEALNGEIIHVGV